MDRNQLLERWCNGEVTKQYVEDELDLADNCDQPYELSRGEVMLTVCVVAVLVGVWVLK